MFRSAENLRLAADMHALQRVAAPWRASRGIWFDGTPESLEARLAATERVLTYAQSGLTPAHLELGREASTARAELIEARHRLLTDFLDDGARAFRGSRRVAVLSDEDRSRMSDEMMQTIDSYRGEPNTGAGIPNDVHSFGQLHDYFDANVGWSDEIDGLDTDDWADLQNHVNDRMQDQHLKKIYPDGLDPDARQDPFDPRLIGAGRRVAGHADEYEADINDPIEDAECSNCGVGLDARDNGCYNCGMTFKGRPSARGESGFRGEPGVPNEWDRRKGSRRVAGDGPGFGSIDDLMFPNHRQPTGADYLAEMEPEDRPGYGEDGTGRCKHCEETIAEKGMGYAHYDGHNRIGEPHYYDSDHDAEPEDDEDGVHHWASRRTATVADFNDALLFDN